MFNYFCDKILLNMLRKFYFKILLILLLSEEIGELS